MPLAVDPEGLAESALPVIAMLTSSGLVAAVAVPMRLNDKAG